MSESQRSNSVTKVRNLFRQEQKQFTLKDIAIALPELKTSQISMTLCYLTKNNFTTRSKMPTNGTQRRKEVWLYTYSDQKFTASQTGI